MKSIKSYHYVFFVYKINDIFMNTIIYIDRTIYLEYMNINAIPTLIFVYAGLRYVISMYAYVWNIGRMCW